MFTICNILGLTEKVPVSTNIGKNLTGGQLVFYVLVLFSDISFVKNDGGKHMLVVV